MKIVMNRKRILLALLLIMVSITSIFYIYKKISYQRPIAAKLVFKDDFRSGV